MMPHDRSATERIVRHLARHGIAARVDQRLQSKNAISDYWLRVSGFADPERT
jgi:hypothetical protein